MLRLEEASCVMLYYNLEHSVMACVMLYYNLEHSVMKRTKKNILVSNITDLCQSS